jgi:hypothetical protein
MKSLKFIIIITLALSGLLGCKKEISTPEISDMYFSMKDSDGKDSIVTEGIAGNILKITVKTDANICVIWPAGIRDTLKSEINPLADSIDNRGIVMRRCDDYSVYKQKQLTGVYGHVMQQFLDMSGFTLEYIDEETEDPGFLSPGTYTITVVATKDGYNGGYKQVVFDKTILVK